MMERRDSYTALKEKTIESILRGRRNLAVWGVTAEGVRLLAELFKMGFGNYVSCVIDDDRSMHGQQIHSLKVISPEEVGDKTIDVLVIASDEEKEGILRKFSQIDDRIPDVILSGSKHYGYRSDRLDQITKSSPVRSIAAGYPNMLIHIVQSLEYLVQRNTLGAVVEFGVYQGGTLTIIAKTLRGLGWKGKIIGFDLFGSPFKRRSVMDVFPLGKYSSDLEAVKQYCEPHGVDLIKGDICETIGALKGIPLMFSFFDTDFYSPTIAALEMCYEQTSPGGIIAFDHYFSEGWEDTIGERIAAKDVLLGKPVFHLHGTGIFLKVA